MTLPKPDRCTHTANLLDVVLAEGDLTADERAHVGGCPACARALAESRAFQGELSRVGNAVTREALPLASTLLAARDLEMREDSMTIRPPIRLAGAAIAVAAALASLYLLQPSQAPEVAASASAMPSAGASGMGISSPPAALSPNGVALRLDVSPAQVLPIPGGAVATRIVDENLELVGAWGTSATDANTGLLAVDPVEVDASDGSYLQTVGITCNGGPFVGRSFIFGATNEPGDITAFGLDASVAGDPAPRRRVPEPEIRVFVFALADGAPHRSYTVISQGINPGDSKYGVGGWFQPWDCSGSRESVTAVARAETARQVDLSRRARALARAAAPEAALMSAASCGSDLVSVLWPATGDTSARVVVSPDAGPSREVAVDGPDAPEVGRLRAGLRGPCTGLPNPSEPRDYDLLPDLDGVRGALDAERGIRGTMTIAYPTTNEAIIAVAPSLILRGAGADGSGHLAVARRIGSNWRLVGAVGVPGMHGLTNLGLVHVGALEGASTDYAVVFGQPATPEPMSVELTVGGVTYGYPIVRGAFDAGDGFLAVLRASSEEVVSYRYVTADGSVVEEGTVPAR